MPGKKTKAKAKAKPVGEAKREDGRGAEEVYTPSCQVGVLDNATGSAYVEAGGCKVMCGVFGPKQLVGDFEEIAAVKVNYDISAFAEEVRKEQRTTHTADRATQASLEEVFTCSVVRERYPKNLIEINFQIIERPTPGAEYPLAVLAASLALANAGIELHELPLAASVSHTNGTLYVSPTPAEVVHASAIITTTCLPQRGTVLSISHSGSTPVELTEKAINLSLQACVVLREVAVEVLKGL